jgi:hypothetical protein
MCWTGCYGEEHLTPTSPEKVKPKAKSYSQKLERFPFLRIMLGEGGIIHPRSQRLFRGLSAGFLFFSLKGVLSQNILKKTIWD